MTAGIGKISRCFPRTTTGAAIATHGRGKTQEAFEERGHPVL